MADALVTPKDQAAQGRRTALLGSLFLMATSAIGPGFITQTGQFTYTLGAAFAFAILISVIIDVAVQLNVWRIVGVSGMKAQELANSVIPGLGIFLAILVALGGFVFNVGNVAGGGLGMNSMLGLDPKIGGIITALLAIGVFISKRAGVALDRIVVALGVIMIVATLYVAIVSNPPVGEALKQSVLPEEIDFTIITTLVGGTVGGYITYAGAHRMLDAGISGPEYVKDISRSSVTGIIITGIMRFLLFLAILGVVATGVQLDTESSIAGQAFGIAAGEVGTRLFGLILWGAAISSVIGAAFTSVSFLTSSKTSVAMKNGLTIGFIVISTIVFIIAGKAPATLLIVAGAVNGLILPVGFGVLMFVATFFAKSLLKGYKYPLWLIIIGWASWLLTIYLGVMSLSGIAKLWAG
ncbi:divalent metal cation transporter [Rothia sp. P100]|uniref:NRAMP family divalent metal transporter n=1 Tax=Rothia sp. P100 TaxID=2939578 RepID=UPI002041D23B|nr:NRAMP family divalent metal transporter [Rothia sp. P100]MCM3510799.1 divalent metal cation transporter [Rothia sp. P100]